MSAADEIAAITVIEGLFRQAEDLLASPARAWGWVYDHPTVLQGQGHSSRRFARAIAEIASGCAELKAALDQPGTMLDIGTGTGWIAIEAARLWPQWNIVGIDRWEPALELARENIAANGLGRRIDLRAQSVEQLEDEAAFTLTWIPGPFLPIECVSAAVERVRRALVPGGWLVFAVTTPPPLPWGEPLSSLRIARHGGHPWKVAAVEAMLAGFGFSEIASHPFPGTALVVGRTVVANRNP